MTTSVTKLISKNTFLRYVEVQNSGIYNMVMDARAAANEIGISLDDYFLIIKNYSELRERYLGD